MAATVALLAALDTKAADAEFLRDRLEAAGHPVLVVDVGILGEPGFVPAVLRETVARRGGADLEGLRRRRDRAESVPVMAAGAAAVVGELVGSGRVHGVLAIGGGAGTTIGSAAMVGLPLGVPKLILTTVAAGDTRNYVGTADIVLFPSVVDVAGVNRISAVTYARAADALAGMLGGAARPAAAGPGDGRPLVAATMFGVTTPCVTRARERLDEGGCETLVFHATGTGGRTMERLVDEGRVDAVLDLTTTEWADEVVGGILSAGPDRLSAAGRAGLAQVVAPGATDMVNFGPPGSVPARFADRVFYRHNAENTLMRVAPEEAERIGTAIGWQLDAATGPTVVLVPTRGVSALDATGQPFDDPVARAALVRALRAALTSPHVRVEEHDMHLNDPAFADLAAASLLGLLQGGHRAPAAHRVVHP